MKIERLTEDKIRIILTLEDLEINNVNFKSLLTNSDESQKLLLKMLTEAEKKVGFKTADCKLLIEALASPGEEFVFTITKFAPDKKANTPYKRKLTAKRKTQNLQSDSLVYGFDNFDSFCDFCTYINKNSMINIKNIAKSISLYLYKNTYYLVISEFNIDSPDLKLFASSICEFTTMQNFSDNFKSKIFEYGKVIMKKNAIQKGIKFFAN